MEALAGTEGLEYLVNGQRDVQEILDEQKT
jgi:hypothetical protein